MFSAVSRNTSILKRNFQAPVLQNKVKWKHSEMYVRVCTHGPQEPSHLNTRCSPVHTYTKSAEHTGMFFIPGTLRLKLFTASAPALPCSGPANTLLLPALSLPGLGGRGATRSNPGPFPRRRHRARGGSSRTMRALGFLFPKKVVTAGRGPADRS